MEPCGAAGVERGEPGDLFGVVPGAVDLADDEYLGVAGAVGVGAAGGAVARRGAGHGAEPGVAAGGTYTDSAGHTQVFVVSQVNGRWRQAKEVPGTAALNIGGNAKINTISCAPAGTCTAGGGYADSASPR